MSAKKNTKRKASVKERTSSAPASSLLAAAGVTQPLVTIAQQMRSWADTVLSMAGTATNLSLSLVQSKVPGKKAAIEKAGSLLRDMRETAGLTAQELAAAVGLSDAKALELAETGKIALPFEVILRLAGVLGRNDPIPFVMKLTRSYNPELWKALDSLGVGKLIVQAGREREFANVYRAHDAARKLSDEEFAAALAFVNAAFELALALHKSPRAT